MVQKSLARTGGHCDRKSTFAGNDPNASDGAA